MSRFAKTLAVGLVLSTLAVLPLSKADSAAAVTKSAIVPACIQGQLQVAVESGGGLQVGTPQGYTFLVVNITSHSCALQGFPWWIVLSTSGGNTLKTSVLHRPNSLYAQPPAQRVILSRHNVASFGMSYQYVRAPQFAGNPACQASFIDFRLPAIKARMFSFEFPLHIDVCATDRKFDVSPVEAAPAPLA